MTDERAASTAHNQKMARKKAARDRLMARIDREKGLLIVHTGPGKGKTTAALGMVLRALGHGFKVGIVQFIKGARDSGERRALEAFGDRVLVKALGEGFTWETQDRERDIAATVRAWQEAAAMIADPEFGLVVLDEINVALRYGYLDLAEVLGVLAARPEGSHVVLTGRGAKEELIAAADLVTEMTLVKHPFREGVKAQAGIEF